MGVVIFDGYGKAEATSCLAVGVDGYRASGGLEFGDSGISGKVC